MKLYVIRATAKLQKVGISKHPAVRLAQLSTGCPYALELSHEADCSELSALIAERIAHRILARYRQRGEWFACTVDQATAAVDQAIIEAQAEIEAVATRIVAARRTAPEGHPGSLLSETLARHDLKVGKAAKLLQVSRQSLYLVLLGEQKITPPMALRLGKLFGTGGEYWLERQFLYDISLLRSEMKEVIDQIPTMEAA
jgi:addiction module HigA family antidote